MEPARGDCGQSHARFLRIGLAVIALSLGAPSMLPPAGATTVVAFGAEDLAARAALVVHATCTRAEAFRDGRGRIVTRYTLEVIEVLAGDHAPVIEFVQPGGDHRGLTTVIPGLSRHVAGDEVILFLSEAYGEQGTNRLPIGLDQGVYRVRTSPEDGSQRVVRDTSELSLVPSDGAERAGRHFPENVSPATFKKAVRATLARLEKK